MSGNIYAITILLIIASTTFVVWRYGHWPPNWKRILIAFLFVGIYYAYTFLMMLASNGVASGSRDNYAVVGFLVIFSLVDIKKVRRIMVISYIVAISFLSFLSFSMRGSTVYSTSQEVRGSGDQYYRELHNDTVKTYIMGQIERHPDWGDQVYPEGPLVESAVWPLIEQTITEKDRFDFKYSMNYCTVTNYTSYMLWHTFFTGFFGSSPYKRHLWYPGGKLKDGIQHMTYR